MNVFDSVILGIVEGFTEFLPISSTAHLILTSHILGLDQDAFVKTFEIAIQSGAMVAVIILYWKKFLDLEVLKRILAAFVPTAIIGLAIYKFAKEFLMGNVLVVLWALAIGGVLLIVFEKFVTTKVETLEESGVEKLSYKKSIIVGIVQAMAIIPGVSRSAATIIGGLLLGINRATIVEFSFLLAVPTILAATVLDVYKNISLFTSDQIVNLSVGFVAAFVTAVFGIKFLLYYVKNRSFIGFGVYRIVLVILFVIIFL